MEADYTDSGGNYSLPNHEMINLNIISDDAMETLTHTSDTTEEGNGESSTDNGATIPGFEFIALMRQTPAFNLTFYLSCLISRKPKLSLENQIDL